jgi:lysophosphatidate acyltransferase
MSFLGLFVKPVAYIGVPIYALYKVSEASPVARYYFRRGIYLSTIGICSIWGVISSVGMTILGRQLDTSWVVARTFHFMAGRSLDISFEVEGEENLQHTGGAVLLGNHQSMLDILYIGR